MFNLRTQLGSFGSKVLVLVLLFLFLYPVTAFGLEAKFFVGKNSYEIDDISYEMDAAPFIKEGRLFVPLRYIAMTCGVKQEDIKYDQATQTVTLFNPGKGNIKLQLNSNNMVLYGVDTPMDVAPEMVNNRIYLPLRYVALAFGQNVNWDEQAQAVSIDLGEFLEKAKESFAKEDYSDVVKQCSSIIQRSPKSAGAFLIRANAYYNLRNYSSAIEDCSQAIKLDEKFAEAYDLRGWANYHTNKRQNAVDDLSMAVKVSNKASFLTSRADLYVCYSQYGKALEDCDKAVELEPNNIYALFRRSMLRHDTGDKEGFMADVIKIAQLDPSNKYANEIITYGAKGYSFRFNDKPEH